MTGTQWQFDASHGRLLVRTGVAGRAAKMGHRLTLAMERWQATVTWADGRPTAVHLDTEVDSLRVLQGDGGLTPLTPPEKSLIRSNALKCLGGDKHPLIRFACTRIEPTDDGYRLTGELEIRGRKRPHVLAVQAAQTDDCWQVDGSTEVRHSDFGVRRYSMMMGAMQVADEVVVSLSATTGSGAGRTEKM
ncbi:YceI family protein [[Mycobacterium] kokjensenii]|uniref:YceI family protein n=1 Tax=[Mycobacterium] kokjensenii TaxID=3064287 RepID=UPI00359F4348